MGIFESISAIAEAVKAVFVFLATTEGQETVKAWRADAQLWNQSIAKAGAWIEGLLGK